MKRRQLSRGLSHRFLSDLEGHGMNERLAQVVGKDRYVRYMWMVRLRELVPILGESDEESQARKTMGAGLYFSHPEAYQFLGEELGGSSEYDEQIGRFFRKGALSEEVLVSHRQREHALVWMPAISLSAMRALLPEGFFPKHHNDFVWPLGYETIWSQQVIEPGFRFIGTEFIEGSIGKSERVQTQLLRGLEYIPHPCEVAYFQLLTWLTCGRTAFQSSSMNVRCVYSNPGGSTGRVQQRFVPYRREYGPNGNTGFWFGPDSNSVENTGVGIVSCERVMVS